jgi:predicted HD phosphohydrolase
MDTRQSASLNTTSSSLFKPVSQNVLALRKSTLAKYCSAMCNFSVMLEALQEQGLCKDHQPISYSMDDFLNTYFIDSSPFLSMSPIHLLANELSETVSEADDIPEMFSSLSNEIDCYLAMLIDVLNNQLAQKPYENVCDNENVTEQEHALQAGKIALITGMHACDVLALLFHDIARPSVNDPLHGHANHCKEGGIILSPLGLEVDYSSYHALAKYLLYTFCPPYKELISTVSEYSLGIQKKNLQEQFMELNQLSSQQLAPFLFQIIFMRLIDDMSKVPALELRKITGDKQVDYFNRQMIEVMLKKQMMAHFHLLAHQSKNKDDSINQMKEKFDAAILLMLRARKYSNHSSLYEKYHAIIDLLEEREIGTALRITN